MKFQICPHQKENGAVELRGDYSNETIWANLNQIADLFDVDKSGISRHIRNIFSSGELDKKRTVAKFATVQTEGKRNIERDIEYYDLDIILSVGYRVNSKKATLFRKWATKTLRKYIREGFIINKNRIAENYDQFIGAVENIKKLLLAGSQIDNANVLELISAFADTWLSLDAYDKDRLKISGATKQKIALTAEKLTQVLFEFKSVLMEKREATELFGKERQNNAVDGIVGNVMQSFGGKNLYPTVEEKAAHLLYFVVKNHPFVDGNKRSGAYAFVWFLRQAKILDVAKITPPALTALTILVAESNPKDKEKTIRLILTLLAKNNKK
ncbi:MAG: virulence protein RhuM/Fic/DOC family protein [Parcubacteria group bacterium]|nr:virulence protein RhuM/Fic/DOC family protein [Parcubacteria group bacterium]